jgi:hypothetical protein
MKRKLIFGFLIFLCVLAVLLNLTKRSHAETVYIAASCSYADVNDCVNSGGANTCSPGGSHTAVSGDVILIPSGSCTWTSSLSVSANITLQGNGTPNTLPSQFGAGTLNTIITYNFTSTSLIVAQLPYSSGALFRLSSLDVEPGSSVTTPGQIVLSVTGTCTSSGCPNARIDNIYFGKTSAFTAAVTDKPLLAVNDVFGVADHNQTGTASSPHFIDIEFSAWQNVGGNGDNSWAQPDTWGSASEFYCENNLVNFILAFSDAELAAEGSGGGIGGARDVMRFNEMNLPSSAQPSGVIGGHGLDTDGRPRSIRQVEAYGNVVNNTSGYSAGGLVDIRGGTVLSFGNTLEASGSGSVFKDAITAAVYRSGYEADNGWGACGGASPYDTNDGASVTSPSTFTSVGSATQPTATVTDTNANGGSGWTTNQFAPGAKLYFVYDTTQSTTYTRVAQIVSNTATVLTINTNDPHWTASSGDSYVIIGTTLYYSGTMSASGGLTMTDSSQSFPNLNPSGSPYTVFDPSQSSPPSSPGLAPFWAEVASNTATTITVQSPNHGPWTGFNNGDTYYILRATVCADQFGRGTGNYVSGTVPSPASALSQALDPAYEWDDVYAAGFSAGNVSNSDTSRFITNRDYYTDGSNGSPHVQTSPTSPFNGTSGVGFGTLANRPSTCTTGTAYWATDQGNWNTSGQTYAGGYSQGELFICTASAWSSTPSYVPYTYPHPLTQGILTPTAPAPFFAEQEKIVPKAGIE